MILFLTQNAPVPEPITGILVGVTFFYFFPWIIALCQRRNATAVFVMNLFLGWTLIGWVVALVMAVWQKPEEVLK